MKFEISFVLREELKPIIVDASDEQHALLQVYAGLQRMAPEDMLRIIITAKE